MAHLHTAINPRTIVSGSGHTWSGLDTVTISRSFPNSHQVIAHRQFIANERVILDHKKTTHMVVDFSRETLDALAKQILNEYDGYYSYRHPDSDSEDDDSY